MQTLSIAKEFSETPGARYKKDSQYSGEDFRESLLKPKFESAIKDSEKLQVILDGTKGYAASFLEEAFGGLARECGIKKVLDNLELVSTGEEYLKSDIIEYINNSEK